MCYTLILMFWWLGAHFLYKILQIQNFIRPDPVKKTGKTGKIKVYEYPTCDISFFIFFHGELIFNVGFIKFGFLKIFWRIFQKIFWRIFQKIFWKIFENIFWRFFIIMKYNKIEWFLQCNVKQFGGFFKIFVEDFS